MPAMCTGSGEEFVAAFSGTLGKSIAMLALSTSITALLLMVVGFDPIFTWVKVANDMARSAGISKIFSLFRSFHFVNVYGYIFIL